MCYDDERVRLMIKLMNVSLSPLSWALSVRLLEVMQKPMTSRRRRVLLMRIATALEFAENRCHVA